MVIMIVSGCASTHNSPAPPQLPTWGNTPHVDPAEQAQSKKVEVKRFPTIESPDEVKSGEGVTVMISLTEELITPMVKVTQGKTDADGKLELSLPKQVDDQDWEIDVVLSASGFSFDGPNKATIYLPKEGDSTPAMFQLTAKESQVIASQRRLYATFWHKGQYIARVMKPIIVQQAVQSTTSQQSTTAQLRLTNVPQCAADATLSSESGKIVREAQTIGVAGERNIADLTIYMRRDWDSCSSTDYFITLSSPHIETRHERISLPEDINQWLLPKYQQFSRKGRGISVEETKETDVAEKDHMLGFGKLLYKQFAPKSLTESYDALIKKLGDDFNTIQIYTDDPSIPWELMVADNSSEFIGIKHAVGRWIIPKTSNNFNVPNQSLDIERIVIVAPEYSGGKVLEATAKEAQFIKTLQWKTPTEQIDGNYSSIKSTLQSSQTGIFHYAGHGYTTRDVNSNIIDYGLLLEDERLRSLNWRGILNEQTNSSFVFFNACEVGQSEKAAGFVDGWSTTLTDTGSSGFISGLWELGDQGAAEFSRRFYQDLQKQFETTGRASIATAMRSARQAFLETGNPTYLAYVFYGDPALKLHIK